MTGLIVLSAILTEIEVEYLSRATLQYRGPAHCSDEMAYALGFQSEEDLAVRCAEYRRALREDRGLRPADWARVVMTAELSFASDLQGTGCDWRTTVGIDECEFIRVLRSIQRKLGPHLRDYYHRRPD